MRGLFAVLTLFYPTCEAELIHKMDTSGNSGVSPPRKVARTVEHGSPPSQEHVVVDDEKRIDEKLGDIAVKIENSLTETTGSPGSITSSVVSDIPFNEGDVAVLREVMAKLMSSVDTPPSGMGADAPRIAPRGVGQSTMGDVAREEIMAVEEGAVVDALVIGGFYDDPKLWPKDLKRAYKEHIRHNIQIVRDALGEGVVAERQVRDFFSNQGDVICVLDYPPKDQAGACVNLAFAFSKSCSEANGVAVLDVHSRCIRQHVYAFAKTSGSWHDGVEVVEMIDKNGSPAYVALTAVAKDSLMYDFVERHPTFIRNDVHPEALVKRSHLGSKHVDEGDEIFARFIKLRQSYVAARNKARGGSGVAPTFVWNAGFGRDGSERTGALAALFVSLELAQVAHLGGMHHPAFVFRKENPLVQFSAASYDKAVCDACKAAGRQVVDETCWQRFVGVAEMTPEERKLKERECAEFYSALGSLVWMSRGKAGSNKRAVYDEFLAQDMSAEQAAHMAQAKVLFDGAVQAAVRRLGMNEEALEALSEEDRKVLQRASAAADAARVQLEAAATWACETKENVAAMSKTQKHTMLSRYLIHCQLKAAAEWDGLSEDDLSKLSKRKQEELVEKFESDVEVRAAASSAKLSDEELAAMSNEGKKALVSRYNFDCMLQAAASWDKLSDEELAAMSDEEKQALVSRYNFDCKVQAAARWAELSDEELAAMSDEGKKALMSRHSRTSTRQGSVTAAARWFEVDPDEIAAMTSKETTSLLGRFLKERKAIAACAKLGISEDELAEMPRERVVEIMRNHCFHGELKSALRWKKKNVTDGEIMSETEQIDLVEEHRRSSLLASACEAFEENFDTVSTTWTDAERGELVDAYNSLRRCEELGFSKEETRLLSREERKAVKHAYNKKLLLERLGLAPEEEDDEDAEDGTGENETVNVEFDIGMSMSLDELWNMIAMRDGGVTPERSIRLTCALNLGLSKDKVDSLSDEDLDRARVYRMQRGTQEKNTRRGLFHVPGTAEHAEIVYTIQSYLKAAGVGILADIVGAEKFADDWAFRKSNLQDKYNVYVRETWHGIPVWIPHVETMLRTLGLKRKSAMNRPFLRVAAISDYVYRRRFDLFGDKLSPEALERLAPREMFSKQTIAERAKLQRRIERNEEREFKFPTDAIFDQVLGELSADPTAKFRMDGEWATRICLQHRRFIHADGREQFVDYLCYRDDEGSWNGPWVDWGLLPNERSKRSKSANIEILNALDARLRRRRREVDEQVEDGFFDDEN